MKVFKACAIVAAASFAVMAYSQMQSTSLQKDTLEALRQMTVAVTMQHQGVYGSLRERYGDLVFMGNFSHAEALDSLYHDSQKIEPYRPPKEISKEDLMNWAKDYLDQSKDMP